MSDGVLSGVRVIDFGRYVAGPYCAALLGDHGADVIRVEKAEGSEDRYLLPVTETGEGALFLQVNRNKRSVALDPTSPEGRLIVERLVKTADVVVANLPPATLASMGLDYETLKALKADIILVNISAFGQTGPWRDRLGFDSVGQAMCGSVYMTGEEGAPYRAQANWVDFSTAQNAAFGTMLALFERSRTGLGQEVRADLLSAAITVNNAVLIEQAMVAPDRRPQGNRGANSAPTDLFQARDGWLLTHVVGQPLFKRWARLMGEDHWLADPRFASDAARGENGAIISARMASWCAELGRDEALERLAQAGIPAGPVLRPSETLEHPQVTASGMMSAVDFPGAAASAPVAMTPFSLSRTPGALRRRPPTLGEHSDEILREIGCADTVSCDGPSN